MNNQSGFDAQNLFGREDVINQGSADSLGVENFDSNQNPDGAYSELLSSESIELTPVESSPTEAELEIFEVKAASASGIDNYTIFAEGKLTVKSRSDFDGDPLNLRDDASIYTAEGFEFNSSPTLPILRDETGEAILDAEGRQQLLDGAVVVAEGYRRAKANNSNISGLIPPQTVEPQTLELPAYGDLVAESLATRILPDTEPVIFNTKRNKIRNASDWNDKFPPGGTPDNPTYVRVTGGKLDIPNNVDLSNYAIIVDKGNIQFKGSNNNLDNVLLQAESGKIDAKKLVANDSVLLASDKIDIKSESRFTGENLIANGKGKIEFKSEVTTPNESDSLRVISADDVELKSGFDVRGQLLAADDLTIKSRGTFYGSLAAKDDITFNSRVEVYATPNESEITVAIDSITVTEGDEAAIATLNLSLSEESNSPITIDYATNDGTAVAGSDYTATTGTVSFEPGETEQTIEIPIAGDNVDEVDEAFEVRLTNPDGVTLSNDTATVEILDDDEPPQIAIASVEVSEDSAATEFVVTLTNPSSFPVTVDFATVDGLALAGSDYQASSGTLTFEPGETTKTVAVELIDDSIYETSEAFTLELTNPSNGAIATPSATATIVENDEPPQLSINSVVVVEGRDEVANFDVTLDQPAAVPVTVEYTAIGVEGTTVSGSVTFAPGEISQTIVSIPVTEDNIDELDETYTVELSNAVNATILNGRGTATIEDNDPPPVISVADIFINEGNEGTSSAVYTVSLDNPSGKEITVDYFTADGTAVAEADYEATSGTLTFAPGETSKTVTVATTNDSLDEDNETLSLNLDNASNAVIGELQATGTITDDDEAPIATVNEVSVVEDSDRSLAVFTIELSAPSGREITLDYATVDGSAVAGEDYEAASGTITFAPGETSKSISVALLGDSLDEIDESFSLQFDNASNVTLTSDTVAATIVDEDPTPGIALSDAVVTEGNEGTTNVSFTLNLDAPSGKEITVDYATVDGTAVAGSDYEAANGTITFAPGETTKTIEVEILSDALDEIDEAFALELSNPSNAELDSAEASATITDDDEAPTVTIDSISPSELDEGTSSAVYTVSLDNPSGKEITVDYFTADGTAIAGEDYQAASGTLAFAPGETTKTVTVAITDDSLDEDSETLFLNLDNATDAVIGEVERILTIADDDEAPVATVNEVSVVEDSQESTTAVFTVVLDSPSAKEITIDYATVDGSSPNGGTATAGADYEAVSGTITFAPGETSKSISVALLGDSLDEIDESFSLQLSNPSNVTLTSDTVAAVIVDEDPAPGISVGDTVVTEGDEGTTNVSFTLNLDAPSGKEITVDYATVDGTAVAGSDYEAANGTITFAPGETTKTIEVAVNGDLLDEIDEAFTLTLSSPTNVLVTESEATATISDDDEPPTAAIDSISLTELDEGTSSAVFTASLDSPSGRRITVDYFTADGTAIAGEDYAASEGTLVFEPGETSKNIEVAVTGDRVFESDEAFTVNLSNPTFATIDQESGIGTGTIVNNDLPPLELEFNLAEDTGASNSDRISRNATITGAIENLQGSASLNASFSGNEPTDLSDLVAPDGSFTIDLERLGQLNGGDLGDGTYTLRLVASDSETGEVTPNELTFTFDTTNPTLNLIAPVADAEHSSTARLVGRVDEAATVEHTLDGSQIRTAELDSDFEFDSTLAETELDPGTYNTTVTVTDAAGNVTSTEVSFEVKPDEFSLVNGTDSWGAKNSEVVLLGERNGFVTETTVPIELGQTEGSRTLRFEVAPLFDTTDTNALKEDQLAVYLVDPSDPTQTLLDNGSPGSAVFSLAGENADYTPGLVTFDGEAVEIDLTSLSERTEGLLVFQLLNHDSDNRSIIQAGNFSNVVSQTGTEKPLFPESTVFASIGEEMNLATLNPTDTVEVELNNVRFDSDTGKYVGKLQVVNTGEAINRQLAVVFPDLPEGVELLDASGTDEEGNPYINLYNAILPGGLDRGAVSEAIEITFNNPELSRFSLTPQVKSGGVNRAPEFQPIAPLSVMPGNKIALNLEANDPDGDLVTYQIEANGELPTGTLEGDGVLRFNPSPDQIGSYEFTLIATDGVAETRQSVTLEVLPDPITTTRISGVIENVEQQPLAGVPIELGDLQTVTAADGSFTIETDQPLTADTLIVRGEEITGDEVYPYIAEKLPLVLGQEVYEGFNNIIDRPIYLPALDVASGQVIDPNVDTTVTTENIPGASVFVEAGSLSTQEGEAFTETLSITEVPIDLTPAALPETLLPDLVITIQPGEMVFETPAPLSLPNLSGWNPGTEMDLWSINPNTGDFDKVGTGIVSEDGSVVETIDGGIRNSSWHFYSPPPTEPEADDDFEPDDECDECKETQPGTSVVESHSGAVIENHNLVSYQSNSQTRSFELTYDSLRADPRPIVHFGFGEINPYSLARSFTDNLRLTGKLTISDGSGFFYTLPGSPVTPIGAPAGYNYWRIPNQRGEVDVSLQADLKNLPSGKYDYVAYTGVNLLFPTSGSNYVMRGTQYPSVGDILHVNSTDSSFGSGWSLSGWQQLVVNADNSVLLIDGDGGEQLFQAPNQEGEAYTSPPGDYSTLEKLADGTFRRTLEDQTVYKFNENLKLATVVDRNGNETNYEYDENELLTEIVDSVGLTTLFTYNEVGKVSKITDPANRETLLTYDEAGNLVSITDPDNSTRTWEYDTRHHMIAETDKRGNREQTIYDFAGRAKQAIDKDGSPIQFSPVQVQGLNPPEATQSIFPTAYTSNLGNEAYNHYADGSGNTIVTQLDNLGQKVSASDGEGNLPSVERDESRNLVTSSTDARGNETEYIYDDRGNVVNISRPLSETDELDTNSAIFSQIDYPTGSSPQTLDSLDLNLDGNSDLITFNSNQSFSVLSGDEVDSFQPKQDYSIPGSKDSSFLTDFDEDGYLEVVSLDSDGNLALRSGSEAGFGELETYGSIALSETAEITFAQPNYTQAADSLDFLVDTSEYDFLNLVSISGNKPFKQPDYIPVGEPQPKTIFAQLNADEISDRVTLNDDGTFSVEIGNPDGSFEPADNYDLFLEFTDLIDSALITAGDIDNDGDEDVLVAYQEPYYEVEPPAVDGYLTIFRNTGNGTLQRRSTYSGLFSEPYSYPETFVLKDVENDGLLDWIAFDRDNLEVRPIRYNQETGSVSWFTPKLQTDPEYIAVADFVERYVSQDVIATDATKTQLELVSYYIVGNDVDRFKRYDPDFPASVRRSSHTLNDSSEFVAVEDLDQNFVFDWITVAEDRSQVNIYLKNFDGSNKAENNITFDTIPSSVNMGDLDEDGNYDLLAVYEETGDFFAYFGNGDGTFGEPVAYNLPGEYDTPILRDFDADGDEDLIAVVTDEDTGEKTFSIFLDDGEGNYGEPFSYTFTNDPNSFVLKDLDGDGNEDLIAVNSLSQELTVVLNQNNAGFGDEATYSLSDFDYLSFQDLDADGDLDLLTSTENQQAYSLLLNQGDGSFGTALDLEFDNSVQNLAFKDLDGDGNLDLIGSFDTEQQEIFIALGDETGEFDVRTTYSLSNTPTELSFEDLDSNGVFDLIAFNSSQAEVEIFLTEETTTNGVVSTSTTKRTYTSAFNPERVGFVDLDSDSNLDLVITNQSETAYSIRLGNENGIFGSEYQTTSNLATAPAQLSLIDFDGANGLDLLAASEDESQFSVLLNNGDRAFGEPTVFNFSSELANRAWRDVDGDGVLDLISTNDERSAVSIFKGNEDGSYGEETVYNLTNNPSYIALGDLDKNNQPDLISIDEAKSLVTTIATNSDGTLASETNYSVGIESVDTLSVDLDGDGNEDSVATNANRNTVTVKLNRDDGTFEPDVEYEVGNNPVALLAEDVNGDGNLDLITANQNSNNVSVLYGIGDGIFANALPDEEATNINGSQRPFDTTLFDLNNDGYLDLVSADTNRDRVSVLLGTETGEFLAATSYQTGDAPYSVEVDDINGDNVADLITSNNGDGTASVLLGLGNGTFGVTTNYAAGSNPRSLAVDDVNNDGIKDLVAANYGNGTVSVLLGNGDGSFADRSSYNTNYSNLTEIKAGDFNADGVTDLIASEYYNRLVLLQGNGDGSFEYSTQYYVGGNLNDLEVADLNSDGFSDLVTARYGYASVFYGREDGTFDARKDYASGSFTPTSIEIANFNGDTLPEIAIFGSGNDFSLLKNQGNQEFKLQLQQKLGSNTVGFAAGDLDGNNTTEIAAISYSSDGKSLEVTNTTSPLFEEQTYEYDPVFNQVTRETDELGRTTLYELDPDTGDRLAVTQVVGRVGGLDDVTTSYTYTDAGLLDTMSDPLGRTTDNDYDEYGRLIKVTYAKGTEAEASVSYEYDLAGNQTAMVDENGNRTEMEYDGMNRLVKTTYAVGTDEEAVETNEYDAMGNQTATVDANGNRTEMEYDAMERLVETTSPDPDGDGPLASPVSSSVYDESGNLVSSIDPLGRETQYVYDARDRLVETILPDGTVQTSEYDEDNNVVGSEDAGGDTTEQTHDARGRLSQETDALGNLTRYEYDAANQLIAIVDGLGNRTEYEYDELGRQISVTDGEGNVTRTEYDKAGNVVATVDGLDNRTKYEFDERDRNTTVTDAENGTTTTEYDDVGNVISITDELNQTTEYQYDSRNRQTEITDPLSHTTLYEYDEQSNVTAITDANNHSTTFTYDGLNRQTVTTNELGDTTTNTYDAIGNLIATTDELGRSTTYTYDEQNRQIALTDPEGNTSRTEYDAEGNVIATIDALGDRTEYQYDALDRQSAIIDANNQTTSFDYDAVGNLLSVTDPEENVTTYSYDKANRRISDTNQLGDTRSYEYDAASNLIKTTDRNGRVKTYSFDKLNRSTTEVWLDENDNPIRTFNYNYDKASQLISVDDSDSAYAYVYDLNGRLIEVDNAGTPGVPNVVFNYDYDPVGNLLSVTDTIDGEVKGTETFTHDELNRVTRITQRGNDVTDKRVDMSYDAASQMIGMSRYSDLDGTDLVAESNYQYDEFGRLTDLTHESETDILANYNWVYDETNRLTQYTSPEGTADYSYDDLDQITGADYDYQEDESYSYDDNGNRTNDGYVTGENNQLLSDGTYNYEYDAEGNRVRRTEIATGVVTEYEWDYRNRLVAVVTSDSSGNVLADSNYTYDVNNQRIAKSVDANGDGLGEAVVERFVHDGDHIALTFDGEGNLTERFLHGTEVDQVIAEENAGSEVLWALADHQGSVKMLLDNEGDVVNNITYDAFGGVTIESNPNISFRFGYTGREHDDETGLRYHRRRYVDSDRFISEDPIGFESEDTNLYRYVGNNPLNAVDPSGLYGKVVNQTRFIGWTSTGNNSDARQLSIYPGGTIGFGALRIPLQIYHPELSSPRRSSFTPNFDLDADPLINSSDRVIYDTTKATIKHSDTSTLNENVEPWGGRFSPDDNGHIIPNILGGSPNKQYNFFSQIRSINRGEYNQFTQVLVEKLDRLQEKHEDCGDPKPRLNLEIDLRHDGPGKVQGYPLRPTYFQVIAKFSDGKTVSEKFSNRVNARSTRNKSYFRRVVNPYE